MLVIVVHTSIILHSGHSGTCLVLYLLVFLQPFSSSQFPPEFYCFTRNEIAAWVHGQAPVTNQVESSLLVHLQPLKQKVLIFNLNLDYHIVFLWKALLRIFYQRPDRIEMLLTTAFWDKRLLWYAIYNFIFTV